MRTISYLILFTAIFFAACDNNDAFKKYKDGSEYKIIRAKNGQKLRKGDFMEMSAVVTYKDSMLMNTFETGMPQFAPYDTASFPPMYKLIFGDIHVGDSVIIKMPTDSLLKRNEGAPWMLKGQYIVQCYKIQQIFKSQAECDSAAKTHVPLAKALSYKKSVAALTKNISTTWASQIKTDDQIIKNYLQQNNINATKGAWGTYVSIITPGTGEKLNEKSTALVNYTGRTMAVPDTVFDSNTDTAFHHVEPLTVDLSKFNVVTGWIDGLMMLNKGSKAKFYIPSSLAYGPNGRAPHIKPNDNLVFDIEVVDILTPEQADSLMNVRRAEGMAKRQKLMAENKARTKKDSLLSVKKNPARK